MYPKLVNFMASERAGAMADSARDELFRSLLHKTFGCLGKPAMELLGVLGARVETSGRASKASFVAGATQELSVALQNGNELIFQMYKFNYARRIGKAFVPGEQQPTADLG